MTSDSYINFEKKKKNRKKLEDLFYQILRLTVKPQ